LIGLKGLGVLFELFSLVSIGFISLGSCNFVSAFMLLALIGLKGLGVLFELFSLVSIGFISLGSCNFVSTRTVLGLIGARGFGALFELFSSTRPDVDLVIFRSSSRVLPSLVTLLKLTVGVARIIGLEL
jgi:hypothetical protein